MHSSNDKTAEHHVKPPNNLALEKCKVLPLLHCIPNKCPICAPFLKFQFEISRNFVSAVLRSMAETAIDKAS